MSVRRIPSGDGWQLGPEPLADHGFEPRIGAEPKTDLSIARLNRQVQVVTVEHLAWSAIATWAVVTRFLQLGTAPLAPDEARHALFEYDLVNRTNWASATAYHPAWGGWVHLLEAGLFAAVGASDFTARLIFVLGGLVIVAVAFLMRPYLGRAGAIAAAGLIATSPTFTYFSRASAISIVAAALAMVTIAAFMTLIRRPSLRGAIGLGGASGLLCATGTAGSATGGILLVALMLLGVYQAIVRNRVYLNVRIWLERYSATLVAAIIAAGLCGLAAEISLFRLTDIVKDIPKLWNGFSARDYLAGLQYYVPGIVLYDFLIIMTAAIGLVAIVFLRASSRLALFSLLWLVISFGYFLGAHERQSERLVLILLPLVIVGAIGIDDLHHTKAWPYASAVLVALGVAAVYVQVEANFVYATADANEPSWARHANLYWREGATTIQARMHLKEIRRRFPEDGGTVLNLGIWQPSLRWYLRDFRPTSSAKLADLVISPHQPASAVEDSDLENPVSLDLEESWDPTLAGLTPERALRFVFSARAWVPLRDTTIAIGVRPTLDLAPTLIIPPPQPH
jgi:uncharacterized protein (TIGR03663 family)